MRFHITKALSATALIFVLSACSTPKEVTELTEKTAANASIVNTQLAGFVKVRRQIAERRIQLSADLDEAADRLRIEFDAFLESSRAAAAVAGQSKKPNFGALVLEMQRGAEVIRVRQEESQKRRAEARARALASQTALSVPKDDLSTIAKTLGALAKGAKSDKQLALFKDFFIQVLEHIKEAKQETENAGNQAMATAATAN